MAMDTGAGPETVWRAAPPPPDPTRYNLSKFAIELNELTPGLKGKLPPTDCRLRPDQAALERGYYDQVHCWSALSLLHEIRACLSTPLWSTGRMLMLR